MLVAVRQNSRLYTVYQIAGRPVIACRQHAKRNVLRLLPTRDMQPLIQVILGNMVGVGNIGDSHPVTYSTYITGVHQCTLLL